MTSAVNPNRLSEIVDPHVEVEKLATGFKFTEGPLWHPDHRYLLFSDIVGDARWRWTEADGVLEIRRPNNMGNGMTYDAELGLLVCEHATSTVAREPQAGGREVLASRYHGKELNSPNDIVVRSDGSIYFTDPTYGRRPGLGIERDPQLGFRGLYVIPPDRSQPRLQADDFGRPNGLCFSPDESLLYVDDTERALIRVFDVLSDGALGNSRVFAEGIGDGTLASGGVVDGMKCDERGDVWVTGPRGIWVFSPAGEHLGVVNIPEVTANLHWGGPEWRWLFVTARTSVYRLETRTTGRREPFMR